MERGAFSLLLHSARREIYQYVCDIGSSSILEIMRNISSNITENAIRWHLDKLRKAGLIKTLKVGGKSTVYYPSLLREEEVERAVYILKNPIRKMIFQFVVDNEGCKKVDLAEVVERDPSTVSFHLKQMIEADIVKEEQISKNLNRYSLGDLGRRIVEGSINCITRSYIQFILDKFAEDRPCIPRVELQTMKELRIAVSSKRNREEVVISINLGKWAFWKDEYDDLDMETFRFILGEGGEELLEALSRGKPLGKVRNALTLPDPVLRAKLRSLEELKLVENDTITSRGKRLAERILQARA